MQVNSVFSMPWFSASFGYLKTPIDQLENPEQGVIKLHSSDSAQFSEAGMRKLMEENDNYEVFEPKSYQDIQDKLAEMIDDVLAKLGLPTDIEVDIEMTKQGLVYHIDHPRAADIEDALNARPIFAAIAEFGYGIYMMEQAEKARLSVLENFTGSQEEALERIMKEIEKLYAKRFMYDDNGQVINMSMT
jgi:hypothetical protein